MGQWQADKDIHENQLGWHWRAPSDQVFLELGISALSTKRKKMQPTTDEVPEDLVSTMRQELYASLLGALCDEALFLVDDKTREELSTVVPSHQHWLQAVSILQALGIRNSASLEKLRKSLKGLYCTIIACSNLQYVYDFLALRPSRPKCILQFVKSLTSLTCVYFQNIET